jgi:CO/xanthine dehydrogenase FAD-binding subunit
VNVLTPTTLDEALDTLAALSGKATPVAGGTDLFVHWPNHAHKQTQPMLDLSGIESLRAHEWTDTELLLGATTTYWDIIQDPTAQDEMPMLVAAARTVGATQIQSRGTWAGNIVNASPAADGVPALMAMDAVVELTDTTGTESVRLDEFYLGYKQMKRRPEQLVTRIRVPRTERDFESFVKVGSRRAQAITKVGLAITRLGDDWRVVANSVAPVILRCRSVERMLAAKAPIASPEDLLAAVRADIAPIDDIRSTAAYREHVLARVLFYELASACDWVEAGRADA